MCIASESEGRRFLSTESADDMSQKVTYTSALRKVYVRTYRLAREGM